MQSNEFSQFLIDTFIKYTSISSQSKGDEYILPSTPGQTVLLETIRKDLESFGVTDIQYQQDAILIAKIPATEQDLPAMSFMSHVDTVDIGVSPEVHAHVVEFLGQDVVLNEEKNMVFKVEDHPEISKFINEKVIMTDGTSVLGADDKAGVSVMVALAKYIMEESMSHGDIYFLFVPDEEVGLRGAYAFDIEQLPKDVLSYTVDGGPLGEFGYETFNGAGVNIYIKGVSIHPGQAKGIMVNPILVANEIISRLNPLETPEHTSGREGFYLVTDIQGNASEAEVKMILRDFDLEKFNHKKETITQIVNEVQQLHPRAIITLEISDSYSNIANTLDKESPCIKLAEQAMKNLNIPIKIDLIRGGTDGSVFSAKGIPTPNIFTGAHNIHSVYEYLPVSSFTKSLETVVEMVRISPQYKNSIK